MLEHRSEELRRICGVGVSSCVKRSEQKLRMFFQQGDLLSADSNVRFAQPCQVFSEVLGFAEPVLYPAEPALTRLAGPKVTFIPLLRFGRKTRL
jgi:hypothetical protein